MLQPSLIAWALFPLRFCVLHFGGDSDSATTNTTNQLDARVVGGNGSVNVSANGGSSVNVTPTDYGAVMAGRDVARGAIDANTALAMDATRTTAQAASDAARAAAASADRAIASANASSSAAINAVSSSAGLFASNTAAVFDKATKQQTDIFGKATGLVADAFDTSVASNKNTFNSALTELGKAYETAKAGDQRVVSMVGLAVVGLAAVFAFMKKG